MSILVKMHYHIPVEYDRQKDVEIRSIYTYSCSEIFSNLRSLLSILLAFGFSRINSKKTGDR